METECVYAYIYMCVYIMLFMCIYTYILYVMCTSIYTTEVESGMWWLEREIFPSRILYLNSCSSVGVAVWGSYWTPRTSRVYHWGLHFRIYMPCPISISISIFWCANKIYHQLSPLAAWWHSVFLLTDIIGSKSPKQ